MNPNVVKLVTSLNAEYQKRRGKDKDAQFDIIHRPGKDYKTRVSVWQSGSLTIDLATGRGGIPKGRMIELYGNESAGKTTTAMIMLAAIQQQEKQRAIDEPEYTEKTCAFIDAEHAFDPLLAAQYGVDLENLVLLDPETAEQAMDIAEAFIRSGDFAVIIVDSVAALVPTKIADTSMEQQTMAELARFMSKAMSKLTGPAYQKQTTVIFINQLREKVGAYAPNGIVPTTTPGGRALKFYSTLRLEVRRGDQIKVGDEVIGHVVKIRFIKNKIGAPYKEAEYRLIYNVGVDRIDEIGQLAIYGNIVRSGGAWIYFENEHGVPYEINGEVMKFNGRAKFMDALRRIPELYTHIEHLIRGTEHIEAPEIPEELRPQSEDESA